MQNLAGKRVLFFCPRFFNYEKEIKEALEHIGAEVIWYDDRPSNNFYSKAVIRINKKFLKRRIEKYYDQILNVVSKQKIDYLFFVNPESISVDSLKKLTDSFPDATRILYMWDSFRNRKQNLELLQFFSLMYTFDRGDSLAYGLKLRPLFYTNLYRKIVEPTTKYDLIFVGTAHSDRYTFVKKFCRVNGLKKVKLYFYLSSKLLFLIKKLTDRSFKSVKIADISFSSLTHQKIAELMGESKIILDINHPKQVGLTMRTFETLGMQRKLVTSNQEVLNYDFYNKSNILLIDREKPILDDNFLNSPFEPSDEKTLFKYSINGWIAEIFELI